VVLLGAAACLTAPSAALEGAAEHVIVISLDGLVPEYITQSEDYGLELPNIRALRDRGSFARAVVGQYPSSTYPSHTSIATGVRPARHGIFQNTRFDPPEPGEWYFESAAIQAPTLWGEAKQAGLRTSAVSWPVTVGANIDVLYPEGHQNPPGDTWLAAARRQSTPGLIDAVVAELGGFGERDNLDPVKRDRFAVAVALHMVRNYAPNLMLVHLVQTDYAQHATGRHSAESKLAFANLDRHIGEIVEAVRERGLFHRTAFVITGDHGFASVHSTFQPNVVLREAGLLETDASGKVTRWSALADRATIKLRDPQDPGHPSGDLVSRFDRAPLPRPARGDRPRCARLIGRRSTRAPLSRARRRLLGRRRHARRRVLGASQRAGISWLPADAARASHRSPALGCWCPTGSGHATRSPDRHRAHRCPSARLPNA
jgi:predicted AlkP superfamily pyrophosphatase or phosphodiesterase